jgi:hypothetical protein
MACLDLVPSRTEGGEGRLPSLTDYYDTGSDDLFDKCRRFQGFMGELNRRQLFQTQYRVILDGPLDHRIRVRDPLTHRSREMVCFDSNSYLGLHLHPRVVGAVHRALDVAGYGTPSAQLLGGSNRYLVELEEAVSAFCGREATLVFPSGYAANVGILTGLLREGDCVVRDRFCHASLHDGCGWSGARHGGVYRSLDMADLDRLLAREGRHARGKLIVTDGVFSMHGPACASWPTATPPASWSTTPTGSGCWAPTGVGSRSTGRCRGRWTCSWGPSARPRARWAGT